MSGNGYSARDTFPYTASLNCKYYSLFEPFGLIEF